MKFTKMHGLGNDFVVIDATEKTIELSSKKIMQLADRHTGIGFDQLLVLERAQDPSVDYQYRIFNADGGEAMQCGNGARCIALFIYQQGLMNKNEMVLATQLNKHHAIIHDDGDISINMQAPIFIPEQIPFNAERQDFDYLLATPIGDIKVSVLSMGNPHCVILVDDILNIEFEHTGACISTHPRFPMQTNVEFMEIKKPDYVQIRIYERGVGETRACGSGACAAVVAGRLQGLLDKDVIVAMPGGELQVSWEGENQPVWMKGPAVKVFEGVC